MVLELGGTGDPMQNPLCVFLAGRTLFLDRSRTRRRCYRSYQLCN